MARRVIMMSEEEYGAITGRIHSLEQALEDAKQNCCVWQGRTDKLWELLNRPDIEASEQAGNNEYYRWCESIAEKYERVDEEEWITDKARWYNNGRYDYCCSHNINEREYEDVVTKGYLTRISNIEEDKTEGWSDLNPDRWGGSWILSKAWDDAFARYQTHKLETGKCRGPYWHILKTLQDMKQESYCLGDKYNEWYR